MLQQGLDQDEDDNDGDDDDEIYIMMKCLSVCLSQKMITSLKGLSVFLFVMFHPHFFKSRKWKVESEKWKVRSGKLSNPS